jgi:hypothetical protein
MTPDELQQFLSLDRYAPQSGHFFRGMNKTNSNGPKIPPIIPATTPTTMPPEKSMTKISKKSMGRPGHLRLWIRRFAGVASIAKARGQ